MGEQQSEEQPAKSVKQKHAEACIAHRDAAAAWKAWVKTQDETALEYAQAMTAKANALMLAATPQANSIEEHLRLQQHHFVKRNTARF